MMVAGAARGTLLLVPIAPDLPPPQPGEPRVIQLAREVLARPAGRDKLTLALAREPIRQYAARLTFEVEAAVLGQEQARRPRA